MDHVFRKFSYLPFFGPLDYASHLRVYAASLNAPLSSILIPPTRPYGFHGWLFCFFEGCEWELCGMTNVALPPLGRGGPAVHGPDFGDHQMELMPTPPCAGPTGVVAQ